jgi:hypothetical protein
LPPLGRRPQLTPGDPGSSPTPMTKRSASGKGEAERRGEDIHAGGGVDCLGCWVPNLLLPPPPQVGVGAVCRGGAMV